MVTEKKATTKELEGALDKTTEFVGKAVKNLNDVKKLDDVKDTPENKAAIAADESKVVEEKKEKVESKPAVEKKTKKEKKGDGETRNSVPSKKGTKVPDSSGKVELEREYIVPLKRGVLNVPHYRRAKKAVRVLKEFMVKHMKVRDRDLRKVKVDINLNNEIWFRGIKKPMNKVKVKARKIDGIVYVELAEIPAVVGYKIVREAKAKALAVGSKKSVVSGKDKKEEKSEEEKTESPRDDSGEPDEKVDQKEGIKAGAEMDAKMEKSAAKNVQRTATGVHAKKTMPVRKSLKK